MDSCQGHFLSSQHSSPQGDGKQPWEVKHTQEVWPCFFFFFFFSSRLCVCAQLDICRPRILRHLSDINTRASATFAALTLHLRWAHGVYKLQHLDAAKPLHILDVPGDNFCPGYSPLTEREHEAPAIYVDSPHSPQWSPPIEPHSQAAHYGMSSLASVLFSKPWKCVFFSFFPDCNRLPRQRVGAPLRVFGGVLSCDPADNEPSGRRRWHASCSNHNDGSSGLATQSGLF